MDWSLINFLWVALALPLGWVSQRLTRLDKEFNQHRVDAARDYITEDKINSKILKSESNVLKAVEALNKKVDHIESKVDKLLER